MSEPVRALVEYLNTNLISTRDGQCDTLRRFQSQLVGRKSSLFGTAFCLLGNNCLIQYQLCTQEILLQAFRLMLACSGVGCQSGCS